MLRSGPQKKKNIGKTDKKQDPYVSAAIEAGAPSRAAFKLVEINNKHGVLSAGDR